MFKKGKLLPLILLLALLLSLVQAAVVFPRLSAAGDPVNGVALAAEEPSPPIFLPIIWKRGPSTNIFGIDLGAITSSNGLDEMVQAGAQWVRRGNYLWPSVEANKGERNWAAVANIESELITASQNGFKTILVIQNAPAWARKDPNLPCGPIKSEEFSSFASFVRDVVARYSQHPYNVEYYEISNEPDAPSVEPNQVFGCWGDTSDPTYYGGQYYGEMLKAVYPQAKAGHYKAKVVVGGILMGCDPQKSDCASTKFMEGIFASGAGNSFDILNYHTYDYYYEGTVGQYGNPNWNSAWDTNGPAMNAKMAYIKGLLAKYKLEKPIIATEIALLCYNYDKCGQNFEITKAGFLAQSYAYSLVHGLQGSIWYDVFGHWKYNGVLNKDRTPLPAYYAFKTAHMELGESSFLREITNYSGVRVLEFDRGDRKVWIMWALKTSAQKVTLPGQPHAILDVQGNALGAQTSVDVSNIPIYVEW